MPRGGHEIGKAAEPPSLAALVPQLAVELAESGAGNVHRRIDGSLLSADISGFTALTERLAAQGKAGAEEITTLINLCFTELIDAAVRYGGQIVKFGGDAVLVLFRGSDHERRAAGAALAMQASLSGSAAARRARLRMSIGAAEGPFHCFLAGSSHRELLLTGPKASHTIELESRAGSGETLVSRAIADTLPPDLIVDRDNGDGRLSGIYPEPETGPSLRTVEAADLKGLVPTAVAEHFDGFAELGGEHRVATIGFLSATGVDRFLETDGPQRAAEALGHLIDEIHAAGERYGATPLHSDLMPDGVKIALCAGAPYTRGNTSDAIIEAALRLTALESPFEIRVGINRGRVFAGFLGSPRQRTYTIMGDSVNTAARMLTRADRGDIVAVHEVLEDTRRIYRSERIEPFLVKGKSEPVEADFVRTASRLTRREPPAARLTGRAAELASLHSAVGAAQHVQLIGPAGAGKTRLIDELQTQLLDEGFWCLVAGCSPYGATTPYGFLSEVVRQVAGIDDTEPATMGTQLGTQVDKFCPELSPMLPLLGIAARIPVEQTEEAATIDPKFLRVRIHEVLAEFLTSLLPNGAVLIFDDTQWIDAASADFLTAVLRDELAQPWTVIMAARPAGNWPPASADGELDVSEIELAALSDEAIARLIIDGSTTDLPDTVVDRVTRLAGGNPLFAVELTRRIEQVGDDDIPDSVEQLVAARIDALNGEQRRTLRVAAVFGTEFERADLAATLEAPEVDLDGLGEFLDLGRRDTITFRQALFRDVAYEGLPFAQRRRLHLRVGNRLEETTQNRAAIASLLAEHFSAASDHIRAWRYGALAGDEAMAKAATADAAAAYSRALAAVRHLQAVDRGEVVRVAFALGQVWEIIGDYEQAEKAYRRARSASDDPTVEINAMLQIGELRERQGRYQQAANWYTRARRKIPDQPNERISERDIQRLWSEVWYQRAGLNHRRGDHARGIIDARLALGWAEDADDLEGMARALHRVHLNTVYLGREDRIRYGERALELFGELGNIERQSSVLNNMGVGAYFADRWSEAVDYYERATEAGLRAGSLIDGMLGNVNIGEILSDQGHWPEAVERLETARRNFDGGRYPMGAAMVRMFLGVTRFRMGDLNEAADLLARACQELADVGLTETEADARTRLLEVELYRGAAGLSDIESTIDGLGAEQHQAERLRYLRGVAALVEKCWHLWRDDLVDLAEAQRGYDRALTLRLLAKGDNDPNGPRAREADRILDDLGVVRLRSMPTPRR